MYILGLSAFYHDSAACIVKDGEILAAVQEERFSRIKHDKKFPGLAISYCIKQANISPSEIDHVVFYEKPKIKFRRIVETYLAFAPKGVKTFLPAMESWLNQKVFLKSVIRKELSDKISDAVDWKSRLLFSEHHLSHAASAFYPSPFEESAILTLDGVGEWTTTSLALGKGNDIQIIKEIHFPHSLGLLYSAFTYYTGFKVNSGEYKVMGLAPYGEPKYAKTIKDKLVAIAEDGSFQLDMKYFDFATGFTMTNDKFHHIFGGPPRKSESKLSQKEMDIAASIQKVTEEIVVKLAKSIAEKTGEKNLCLAGGVALNCVANGVLLREKIFDDVWIQPASGDAGGALGAALAGWYLYHGKQRKTTGDRDSMRGSYLGPEFSDQEIRVALENCNAKYDRLEEFDLIDRVTTALTQGKAVGWMNGRMEFGPRALGNRSIIADPRSQTMQTQLNLKIKFRESFRPFAPSVLEKHLSEWFEIERESPYMLFVADLEKSRRYEMTQEQKKLFGMEKLKVPRSSVPAITHVDYSARIQTVHEDTNPRYHALIKRFYEKTGCPMLVNTSFNVRGEPIACSPRDAFKCFMGTDLDVLVIGNFILFKADQDTSSRKNYQDQYELD